MHLINSRTIPWALFLVLAREFAVTSVRLLAAKDGVVVAASFAGKLKTVMQMVAIIYMLTYKQAVRFDVVRAIPGAVKWGSLFGMALIWISVAATVISGIQYIWQLRHYFKEETAEK